MICKIGLSKLKYELKEQRDSNEYELNVITQPLCITTLIALKKLRETERGREKNQSFFFRFKVHFCLKIILLVIENFLGQVLLLFIHLVTSNIRN